MKVNDLNINISYFSCFALVKRSVHVSKTRCEEESLDAGFVADLVDKCCVLKLFCTWLQELTSHTS